MTDYVREGTILVTGGTGFVGKHLVNELKEKGCNLIVLSREADNLKRNNIKYLRYDLSDLKTNKISLSEIKKLLKKVRFVVHLAATMSKHTLDDRLYDALYGNFILSINLLSILPEKLNRFIFASTVDVYGIPKTIPVNEDHPTNPITFYGASKLSIEKFYQVYFLNKGIRLTTLRFSHIYGEEEPKVKAIPHFIDAAVRKIQPVLHGNGLDKRDFVNVRDVVKSIILALGNKTDGIFNVASGRAVSIKEVLDIILKISGEQVEPVFVDSIKPHYDSIIDINTAKNYLSYNPKISLVEGLESQITYAKEQLELS